MKNLTILLLAAIAPSLVSAAKLKSFEYGDISLEPEDSISFSLDDMADEIGGYEVMGEFLPGTVDIVWTGKKFKAPKAGKVKYSKVEGDFISTSDENPAGLSLSVSKKGKVKGSFKVYVQKSDKKLKAYTAKVSGELGGVLIVSIKKVGTWTAALE